MSIFNEKSACAFLSPINASENAVIDVQLKKPLQKNAILKNCIIFKFDFDNAGSQDIFEISEFPHVPNSLTIEKNDVVHHSNVERDIESIDKIQKPALWKGIKQFKKTICFHIMIGFEGFIYGWDTGTISGYVEMEDFKKTFGEYYEDSNSYNIFAPKLGFIISILYLGCIVGAHIAYKFKDNRSRKVGLFLSMMIFIVGIILQISGSHWIQFIVGRVIVGISVGIIDILGPLFALEVSSFQFKGFLTKIYPTMIPFGMLIGYITSFATEYSFTDERQWKIPLGLNFVWALIVIGGLYYLPESPKYLIKKGKTTQAKQSIAKIIEKPEYDEEVSEHYEIFHKEVMEQNKVGEATWNEIYTGEQYQYIRFLIGVFLMSFQQLSGHTLFLYYTTSLFGLLGTSVGYLLSILFGGVYFFSTIISHLTIPRISGRRNLIYGAASLSVCLLSISIGGSTIIFSDQTLETGICLLILICICISVYATTWGPGVAFTTLQNQPDNIRNKSFFVGTLAGWGFAFLTTFLAPMGFLLFQFSYGYFFTFFNVIAGFFVYFMVPETFQLSLQQVETLYQSYSPWNASATLAIAQDKKRIEMAKQAPKIDHHERNKFIAPNYDV